jgi:hypothetical protein
MERYAQIIPHLPDPIRTILSREPDSLVYRQIIDTLTASCKTTVAAGEGNCV